MVKRPSKPLEINEYTGTPEENLNLRDTELRTLREVGHDAEGPVIFTSEDNKHENEDIDWTRIVCWRLDKPFGGYILEWGHSEGYWNELLPDLKAVEARKDFLLQSVRDDTRFHFETFTPLKEWLYDHMHYRTEKWISIQPMPIDGDTQSPHI